MTDTQEPTAAQKKVNIIKALGIAGFTENPEYPGMYARDKGDIREIVDMTAGLSSHLYDIAKKQKILGDDATGTLGKLSQMIVDAEDGRMPTKSDADEVVHVPKKGDVPPPESNEPEEFDPPEPAPQQTDTGNVPTVLNTSQALTQQAMPELSIDIIKKYINDKATDEEAYVFLQLCKARGLNPFVGDAYLIKYDHVSPASTVVGKDAFMKRAEMHLEYDGFEAGIIVETEGTEGFVIADNSRVGTFYYGNEILLGGWAKVYRKDHEHPVEITVSMKEFNTGKSSWKKMPATMIRKVALVNALRESFPSELSGMYDSSEMKVEID